MKPVKTNWAIRALVMPLTACLTITIKVLFMGMRMMT